MLLTKKTKTDICDKVGNLQKNKLMMQKSLDNLRNPNDGKKDKKRCDDLTNKKES